MYRGLTSLHQSTSHTCRVAKPTERRTDQTARWPSADDSNEKDSGISRTDDSAKNEDSSSDLDHAEVDLMRIRRSCSRRDNDAKTWITNNINNNNNNNNNRDALLSVTDNISLRSTSCAAAASRRGNSPAHKTSRDRQQRPLVDATQLAHQMSQVRLAPFCCHGNQSRSGLVPHGSPLSERLVTCSPVRARLIDSDETILGNSSSPTRKAFPRMGTRAETRPSSCSPGRVLSVTSVAAVPDTSSPRRMVSRVEQTIVSPRHNSPLLPASSSQIRETARTANRKLVMEVNRNQLLNGRQQNESTISFRHLGNVSEATREHQHWPQQFIADHKETKRPETEVLKCTVVVNGDQHGRWKSNGTSHYVAQQFLMELGQEVSHLRKQSRYEQHHSKLADGYSGTQGDKNQQFGTKNQHPCNDDWALSRCSRHDDFRNAGAPQRREESLSPNMAKLKRERDCNGKTKKTNRYTEDQSPSPGTVTGSHQSPGPATVTGSHSHETQPNAFSSSHPIQELEPLSDWVVRRRADGTRYVTRRRHSARDRILRERERRLAEERRSTTTTATTTEDDEPADYDGDPEGVQLSWHQQRVRRSQVATSRERKSRRQRALERRLNEVQVELQRQARRLEFYQQPSMRGILSESNF